MNFSTLTLEEKKLFYGEPIFDFDSTPPGETEPNTLPTRTNHPTRHSIYAGPSLHYAKTGCLQKLVISLDNRFKSIWDVIIMLFVIYSSFSTAYTIAFDIDIEHEMSTQLQSFEIFVDACFYLDLILNFFQEFRDPRSFERISEVHLIAKQYLKTWFIIDLLAVLPFQLFGYDRYFQLFRILRLPRLARYLDYGRIEKLLQNMPASKKRTNYLYVCRFAYKILRLILVAATLGYFLGCLWYFIISSTPPTSYGQQNFLEMYGLLNYSRFRRLIICWYFMLTTLTTVGYGDYSPQTEVEKTISIVIMILGISLFSYTLGNFYNLMRTHDEQVGVADYSIDLHKWLKSLRRFTGNEALPRDLVDKISEHFKFFWRNDRLLNLSPDDSYLQKLPKALQYRLIHYMFDDVFALFRGFFHVNAFPYSPFYYELAFSFMPCKFESGEFILKPGQNVDEVYLIKEGSVYIYVEYQGKTIGKCFSKGYFFGANNIFRNAQAQFYYRAIKGAEPCTKVIAISKSKLLGLLRNYPNILATMAQSAKTNDNSLRNMIKTEIKLMLRRSELPCTPTDIDAVYDQCIPKLVTKCNPSDAQKKNDVSAEKLAEVHKGLLEREGKINQKLNQVKKFGDQLGDDLEDILMHLRKVKDSVAKTEKRSVIVNK